MAKSLCVVTLLMVFLLISTGIPKGKAQCKGELRNVVPKGTCMLGYAKVMLMMMQRRPMRDKDHNQLAIPTAAKS
ncbi:unnamed protein product, partial [Brassica rapa subsp. narinosa]